MSRSTEESNLPWPECLGTFDEESCRFFLRELGQRVVQFYPFSVGIEEVYTSIVDKYGYSGACDAISVLQELLEDDTTANGVGDDGDIWRSWRWSWRHRNDNIHTPHVPRAHGRILKPPTSTRIRLLKNANFLAAQNTLEPVETSHNDNGYRSTIIPMIFEEESLSSFTLSFPRSVSAGVLDHCTNSPQANNLNVEVNNRKPIQPFDRTQDNKLKSVASRIRVIEGSPHRSLPASHRVQSIDPRKDCQESQIETTARKDDHELLTTQQSVIKNNVSTSVTEDAHQTHDNGIRAYHEESLRPPTIAFQVNDIDKRLSLPSDLSSQDVENTPRTKRHRQARMIDGALIGGRQRALTVTKDIKVDLHPSMSMQLNVDTKTTRGKEHHPRVSWLHNIIQRFRNEKGKQTKSHSPKLLRKHSSLLNPSNSDIYEKSGTMAQHIYNAGFRASPRKYNTGLDGTDERFPSHNKPLPLSPGDESGRPSIQSDVQRGFFGFDQPTTAFDPYEPFAPPHSESYHNRDELCSLVSATMSGPGEISPKEKALRYRFSESSHGSTQTPPTSVSTQSPTSRIALEYGIDVANSPGARYEVTDRSKKAIISTEWPFRSTTPKSEQESHNLYERRTRSPVTPIRINSPEQRGRRPKTPVTSVSTGKVAFDTPVKNRQRSRSPVKKFMGMVKSLSANQLPHGNSSEKIDTPGSNKGKWKELSHKLRHGFLTADLEQLNQETMMEQYTADQHNNFRIITPPLSRERSTFPISIRSSGQSKLWSELEYMLIESCNTFLKDELANDRLSRESVIKTKRQWQAKNRPHVVEFYYDQSTQYDLVIANLSTIKLYSDYSQDAVMLNSVLHQWKILIRELNVKTLCMPDSVVRRWLHDGRRVLELLGATQITLANIDKLTTLCLAVISSAEKERARMVVRDQVVNSHRIHRRSVSDGSQHTLITHERALLHDDHDYPPLPAPTSSSTTSRKVSDKEQRAGIQAAGMNAMQESIPFTFTYGKGSHAHSKSLGQYESRQAARVNG